MNEKRLETQVAHSQIRCLDWIKMWNKRFDVVDVMVFQKLWMPMERLNCWSVFSLVTLIIALLLCT